MRESWTTISWEVVGQIMDSLTIRTYGRAAFLDAIANRIFEYDWREWARWRMYLQGKMRLHLECDVNYVSTVKKKTDTYLSFNLDSRNEWIWIDVTLPDAPPTFGTRKGDTPSFMPCYQWARFVALVISGHFRLKVGEQVARDGGRKQGILARSDRKVLR